MVEYGTITINDQIANQAASDARSFTETHIPNHAFDMTDSLANTAEIGNEQESHLLEEYQNPMESSTDMEQLELDLLKSSEPINADNNYGGNDTNPIQSEIDVTQSSDKAVSKQNSNKNIAINAEDITNEKHNEELMLQEEIVNKIIPHPPSRDSKPSHSHITHVNVTNVYKSNTSSNSNLMDTMEATLMDVNADVIINAKLPSINKRNLINNQEKHQQDKTECVLPSVQPVNLLQQKENNIPNDNLDREKVSITPAVPVVGISLELLDMNDEDEDLPHDGNNAAAAMRRKFERNSFLTKHRNHIQAKISHLNDHN